MKDMTKVMKMVAALSLGATLAWAQSALACDEGAAKPAAQKPATQEVTLASAAKPAAPKPAAPAKAKVDGKRIEIKVTSEGYQPSPLKLKKGEPVVLAVTRTTDETCALDLVMPEYGIKQELPLNQKVEIAFTPNKTGSLKYGCAMEQMIAGVFIVE